jgi:predicted AlkP superfamily phosphohydrolase/phosphomutase
VLWTSIATGKRQAKHGIDDFVSREAATRTLVPMSIGARKVKAMWDIASEAGRTVDVVGWYGSWPVETVNGVYVSDRALKFNLPQRVTPESRTAELDVIVARVKQEHAGELPMVLEETVSAEVALHLLERDQPQLHLMYVRDIDDMQHLYWRHHAGAKNTRMAQWLYGQPDPEEQAAHARRIEDAYEHTDQVLRRIMKLAGPETLIVVVSDHGAGIKSQRELRFSVDPILAGLGWLTRDADGKTIDWSKTVLHDATKREWLEQRELFLNELPQGPFGAEMTSTARREILEMHAARLRQLTTDGGRAVFERVWLAESKDEPLRIIARMNTHLESAPSDGLTLTPEPGTPAAAPTSLKVRQVAWRTQLSGTHRLNGLLVMAGAGVRPGTRIRAASVLDMTPTVLHALGLPAADDMDGRVLREALDPEWLARHPVTLVPTYETGQGRTAPSSLPESSADEALREQLRSLGYIQ